MEYHKAFASPELQGKVRRPVIPENCQHNAHMYYLLLPSPELRDLALRKLNQQGVNAVFHYIPLHSSPGGIRYARTHGQLMHTNDLSQRIIRLPLWYGMTKEEIEEVVSSTKSVLKEVVCEV